MPQVTPRPLVIQRDIVAAPRLTQHFQIVQ